MHDEYFEGILQLRDPRDEIIKYIKTTVDKRENVRISKEKNVKGGVDLFFSSQKFMLGLGVKLQKRFGGDMKISKKLHTRDKQRSKDIYRGYLYFRPSKYKKDDIINHRGDKIKVISAQKEISPVYVF
jgi:NMD protein affecting ribosome stability and mRNA decay